MPVPQIRRETLQKILAIYRSKQAMVVASCLMMCCFACGQVAYPEQEVSVHDLPLLTAPSMRPSDVLATSLEMVFNNKDVCCGKDSALEDSLQVSNPYSLNQIASKLQGRHLLSNGRPIIVTAEYLPTDAMNVGHLITMILAQRPALMVWNSQLYVLYGVTYVKTVDYSTGAETNAIHRLLLQDARFSDSRRIVSFDRLTNDLGKVQGLLFLQAAPQ